MQLLTAALLLAGISPQVETQVGTGPEPSPIPVSWEIDFEYAGLKRVELSGPGQSVPRVYWYLLYTATNNTDRTVRFFPSIELVTDNLDVLEPNVGINLYVFEAIREVNKTRYPYLVPPTKAIGDLRTGDDNARESVAIWRQIDPDVNNFSIYVAGLSGETRFVPNPAYNPTKPETVTVMGPSGREREVLVNPKNFTLRKTLELQYTFPGSPESREFQEPQLVSKRWIMR